MEIFLEGRNDQIEVVFGQQDGIQVGHVVLAVNGKQARGRKLEDGTDIMKVVKIYKFFQNNTLKCTILKLVPWWFNWSNQYIYI